MGIVSSRLKAVLAARGQAVLDGRLGLVTGQYAFPLPVFLEQRQVVIASENVMQRGLAAVREELLSRRIVRLHPDISATELPRTGRFRVWVRWHEISADGTGDRWSDVIYYCREASGITRTEMLHYTQLSMPELRDTFATLAMSA